MQLHARQGDLVIEKLETINGKLEEFPSLTFAGDSSGHPHTLAGKVLARREGRRFLIKVTGKREITHHRPGGHRTVTLSGTAKNPGYYEVRPLRERGDGSDRAVED
ncbi:MAG TPA: hypothetical protein VFI42_16000 [Thermomicrobiaceae bacterium]|nr:hypothetical protein [Thermomicrobiaceae bacterium]